MHGINILLKLNSHNAVAFNINVYIVIYILAENLDEEMYEP